MKEGFFSCIESHREKMYNFFGNRWASIARFRREPYGIEGREILREVIGVEPPFTGTPASTDMNFRTDDDGIPCFNLGVGGPCGNTRQQDESVFSDELVDLTQITALLYMRKPGIS